MLYNYFIIASRSIRKNGLYSFINVAGLSVGIAASLLILLYVSHEFSFDRFHANADRIYQVQGKVNYGGQEIHMTSMSSQFGPIVLQNDANVENYVRIKPTDAIIKFKNQEPIIEKQFIFSDTSFFSVFSFPLLKGHRKDLSSPNKVIITERSSKKYFGDDNPIGKTLSVNGETELEIIGVAKNPPSNSSIQFDFVASFVTLGTIASEKNQYEHAKASLGSYNTYLLLKDNAASDKTEQIMTKVASGSVDEKYTLNSFTGIHFGTEANLTYIYAFVIIALIILALALVNYMSLTTARASLRAKEVGIRKVIGARRLNLSAQFFIESTLMTVLAFAFSIVWIELLLPVFLDKIQLTIDYNFIQSEAFLAITAVLLLLCIFIAGYYPALVLSKFNPVETLKGKWSGQGKGSWLRKGFTTFQFAASIGLILCTIIIIRQMDFLKNQKLGLTKEMVMVVKLDHHAASHYRVLKNELKTQSGVMKVSSASFTMYQGGTAGFFTRTPITNEDVFINVINVDEHFFSTLDIQWKEKPETDKLIGKYIANESGLTRLKITKEDLGKTLKLGRYESEITGVVKDFNFETLRSGVSGMIMMVQPDSSNSIAQRGGAMYIRFEPETNLSEKMDAIRKVFKKYQNDSPFEYYFLDDAFDRLFKSEDRMSKIFNAFTAIAIFIACLGLLGLITFTSEVRTKEIGIRKILGASVNNIVILLTKDYFILIAIGSFVATPIAWWYMQQWLNTFSYKTQILWWYAPLSALLAVGIALASTCFQSIRCATRNPVESLRSE